MNAKRINVRWVILKIMDAYDQGADITFDTYGSIKVVFWENDDFSEETLIYEAGDDFGEFTSHLVLTVARRMKINEEEITE